MARRISIGSSSSSNGLFSPPPSSSSSRSHHYHLSSSARRRSFTLANGTTSSGSSSASPSSAPWNQRDHALLVRAWRDVAEHPASAVESVDAFQTRLFLRFQELSGVSNDNENDDTVSMAGSECSMESIESSSSNSTGNSSSYSFPRARTQTSVVRKMYALRHMAGFITSFLAQQDALRAMDVDESQESQDSQDAMANEPVDWFALSKTDQIERFQAARATGYIELDEHTYQTIVTTLELQDKSKQQHEKGSNTSPRATATVNGAASSWSMDEVRHVLTAWRDAHLRTPTKVPGADTLYARFLALNGETSQRSKPEVADMKIALIHMQRVIAAFANRAPMRGKLTRNRMQQQQQSWFALSLADKHAAFAAGERSGGCRYVDVTEDMYRTICELLGEPSAPSASPSTSKFASDWTPEPRKRRSLSSEKLQRHRSSSSSSGSDAQPSIKMINLVSDDDDEDDDSAAVKTNNHTTETEKETETQPETTDDVEMEVDDDTAVEPDPESSGSSSSECAAAGPADADKRKDASTPSKALAASVEAAQLCDASTRDAHSAKTADTEDAVTDSDALVDGSSSSSSDSVRSRHNSLKKQKLEHAAVLEPADAPIAVAVEVVSLLEKQAQDLNALVLQVAAERKLERQERERLLTAIKVDQQGREAVLELLRAEQEERRCDREERRKMLQVLLREQQERQASASAAGSSDAKCGVKVKDERDDAVL